MNKQFTLTLAVVALTNVPAFAQNAVAQQSAQVQATAPGDFLTQEGPELWRASKLPGIWVYGPDNKKVGDISDVLMSKDGNAKFVVIGVGGILGIGQKDVAIPFGQVKFSDQRIIPPGATVSPNRTVAPGQDGAMLPAQSPGAVAPVAPGIGLGTTPAAQGGMGSLGAADPGAELPPHSQAYPDHGMIDLTRDQIKAAPDFHFAR